MDSDWGKPRFWNAARRYFQCGSKDKPVRGIAAWQEWSPTGVGIGGLEVVGRPFLWSANKGMQDLNMLIPVSDWVLNSVSDINVWGQIVGSGTLNGESHGFLLTPQ